MQILINTPRLLLRPFQDADLDEFVAYRNDPEVFRFQGWKTPFTREDGAEFIRRMAAIVPGTPGEWIQVAIEHRGDHSLVGDVAFHVARNTPRMAWLGYSLSRKNWRQGYASEAVSALLDHLFRVLDIHRVIADCDVENDASIRLLERLGFRREGHYVESYWMPETGTWGSEYLYAILQREWILR